MLLCLGCMHEYQDRLTVCPHCGYMKDTPVAEVRCLVPGAILQKRYVVGRVLGHGGFGVTYVGFDALLERKIAIKEYLPANCATRTTGNTNLTVFNGEAGAQFAAGLASFIEEARRLAKFNALPGIVSIHDSFDENNTGYIIMEYLEGRTVRAALDADSVFAYDEALKIILEVLRPLKEVHKTGIIHRDIAPDNIFLTGDGRVKLLDFGAARYATAAHTDGMTVILKPGFAPEEQYQSRSQQGPWTDVYALACTFYKMLTGVTPEESPKRRAGGRLPPPSELGAQLPKSAENAILNAMNVDAEDRPCTAEAFEAELTADNVTIDGAKRRKEGGHRIPLWLRILFAALGAVALIAVILAVSGVLKIDTGRETLPERTTYDIAGFYTESGQLLVECGDIIIAGDRQYRVLSKNFAIDYWSQPSVNAAILWWADYLDSLMPGGVVEEIKQ